MRLRKFIIRSDLLSILDEGRLTDHKGNIVSFSECLIICTTNAYYSELLIFRNKERGKMIYRI